MRKIIVIDVLLHVAFVQMKCNRQPNLCLA